MNKHAISLTQPPHHHFFGFHDIPAWDFIGEKLLCLEVDTINRPPLPRELAGVGYVDAECRFKKIGSTYAFNFPQGARMQWISRSEYFIVNNIFQERWGCDLYDTASDKLIDRYPFGCHCGHRDGISTFSINYSRLYRLGAYGYPGLKDVTYSDPVPENDGIIIGNLETRESRLLVSIYDVANYPHKFAHLPYGHHYLTHLVLNPSNTRLAFLHFYPLADGGNISRLMTIGVDGKDMRCLAAGFLSHFDWKDDATIFIFGRANSQFDALRTNPIMSLPMVSQCARLGKKFLKAFLKPGIAANANFLLISDKDEAQVIPVAQNVLITDGHPMFCLSNRDWIVNDTYPNRDGVRTLMLYQFSQNKKIDLGFYKMIEEKPDLNSMDLFFEGVEPKMLEVIGKENLAFTRSGLHCDLHPRWDQHGSKIAFDSIHEGTRQVYMFDVNDVIRGL